MSDYLYDAFSPISKKEWGNKIQMDLNGEDYSSLLTDINEGISIKPFYHGEDAKRLNVQDKNSDFKICQSIFINNIDNAIKIALDSIKQGVDCIKFVAIDKFDINLLYSKLFKICEENLIDIYFELRFLDNEFYSKLISLKPPGKLFLNIDIIGNLCETGNWYKNKSIDHQKIKDIFQNYNNEVVAMGVDVSLYQNAGANSVQEVAYALAHASEYLNHYGEQIGHSLNFNFSVGGNYFVEIAKMRAFRYLWKLVVKEYNLDIKANIFAEPSRRNKGIYDFNNNMIRTTTECMSAILGGSDVINNLAYDSVFHKKNKFGERIARNQLLILKNESNLKNDSAVRGTYFIEELSVDIAKRALEIFKSIEKSGGFIKQLYAGTIQAKINENAKKQMKQFGDGYLVLVGVNKYLNEGERMKRNIELYPFPKRNKKETVIVPIARSRIADKLEEEKLKKESE